MIWGRPFGESMSNRRAERIASLVQKEVASLLRTEAKDPRLVPISITEVRMNQDMSVARIRYVPLGGVGPADLPAALEGAGKQLRGAVGRALGIRHAPELRFERDLNFEHAEHIARLLSQLPPAAEESPAAAEPSAVEDQDASE